jgi:UrcA family protein
MLNATPKFNKVRRAAIALAALSAGLGGLTGVASAGVPDESVRTITVSYGDLNLSSDQGSKALYGRIVSAARAVCGADEVNVRDLHALALEQACETRAIARAVHQVNVPTLAALYSAHLTRG